MYGFRCQALVSLGPLSTPIKDKADRFPVQAVLHPERGVRNFGVLVRIGDDFFVALANLFKRVACPMIFPAWMIRSANVPLRHRH